MPQHLPYSSKIGLLAALGSGALLLGAYYFQYVEKLQQRLFTLGPHHDIDKRRSQDRLGVLRRKIAAPDDGHIRKRLAYVPAHCHGLCELRAGHHRKANISVLAGFQIAFQFL